MLKEIKGWKINKSVNDDHVVVKSFSGATIECMKHYSKPTINQQPDRVILHVGTNDLKSERTVSKIAKDILNLAESINAETKSPVIISGIIPRGDNLNGKAEAVNDVLKKKCMESNIGFIDNSNIKISNLNSSKLHLNKSGTTIFAKNLLDMFYKLES